MKDIEFRLTSKNDTDWELEVYDPNVQHLVGAVSKKFSGVGEAEVWLESFSTLEKSRFIDREDFKVVRGTAQMGSFSLESLLSN
jgi:hypothetical protein